MMMCSKQSLSGGPGDTAAFPDAAALAAYLDKLGLFRMKPGLERMRAVLEHMRLRRPFYYLAQVVGTNGKGSVSTMLDSLAREHGLRVGLHRSPHFLSVRERILVNGQSLTEEHWRRLANTLMLHGADSLSYFEFVTCLALLAFANAGVDIAVMESGLGGTYDATTALEADLVVFTPIDLDHQQVLGHSLKEIAADKAGAVRPGVAVFTCAQHQQALEELGRVSAEREAPLHTVPPSADLPDQVRYPLGLDGVYQQENARLALAAWRHIRSNADFSQTGRLRMLASLRKSRPDELEGRALADAWLPGRFQFVAPRPLMAGGCAGEYAPCAAGWPPMLLDGAHNRHGLAALGRSLACRHIAPAAVIFACLADKDPQSLMPHLRALATGPVFVPPIAGNPRAMPPEDLAALIGINAIPMPSLQEAFEAASTHIASRLPEAFSGQRPNNPLLVCGSLYLLAQVYALRPDCLCRAHLPRADTAAVQNAT